jgi:hypothetical protein
MNARKSRRLRQLAILVALTVCVAGCPPILGPFIWARTDGGVGLDLATGLVPRLGGGAYVCGQFTGMAVFGAGEPNETTLVAAGGAFDTDIFVARYDHTGALDWAVGAGGPQEDYAADIVQLFDGTVVITGFFNDEATFGAGDTNETRLLAAGEFDQDAFVARYSGGGALLWARSEGGLREGDAGTAISAFADGTFVVAGTFEDRAVFDTATPRPTVLNSGGPFDTNVFLARYERDGDLVWASGAGGPADDFPAKVTTTPGGDVVVTGTFEDYAVFSAPGVAPPVELRAASEIDRDVFIARYNGAGTVEWVRRATGIDIDDGLTIGALLDGSVILAGSFFDTVTFAPDTPGETTLMVDTILHRDAFIARYDRDGDFAWARHLEGIDDDEVAAVATIAGGSFVVAGTFTTALTLGVDEPNETTLMADFEFDRNIFVARYNAAGRLEAAERVPAISAAFDVGVVPGDEVLVAGWVSGASTLRSTTGATIPIRAAGEADAFLARLDF